MSDADRISLTPGGAPDSALETGTSSEAATATRITDGKARSHALAWVVLALVLLLVVTTLASIYIGTESLDPKAVTDALLGHGHGDAGALVWDYRVPRTAMAIVVGSALGVAGALIQALTRNPLADPGILGVNAGSALAVTIAVGLFGLGSISSLVLPSLIGAFVATMLVILLASMGRGPGTAVRMTLAGVALAAVFTGLASGIRLSKPSTFERLRSWSAGSVAGRPLSDLVIIAPFVLVTVIVAVFLGRALNAMAFGDEQAAGLGVNVRRIRILTIACVTVLAGCATAIAGPISFIGLMVAHVVRLIVGGDQIRILALSAIAAPSFLLLSDVLSRVVMGQRELPVGVVTAFVGAPVLILLVRRKNVVQA